MPSTCPIATTRLTWLLLLRAGDTGICINPGPVRCPCGMCTKSVRKNQRAILCDGCERWFHAKCMSIDIASYNRLSESDDEWFCDTCILPKFSDSFYSVHEEDPSLSNNIMTINNSSVAQSCHPEPVVNNPLISDPSNEDHNLHNTGTSSTDNHIPTDYDDHFQCFDSKGMHFLHMNARSLLPKLSELRQIATKSKAAVIAITESWLDSSVTNTELHIEGNSIVRKDRNRQGGGVCMYIQDRYAFSVKILTNTHTTGTSSDESIWIEIFLPKSNPLVLGTCYRPPHQTNFLEIFENNVSQLRSDCETVILGDFNICYLKKNCALSKEYTSILRMVDLPTRVTSDSKSLLDHILCNCTEKIAQSGTIAIGLSDHYLTFCTRKISRGHYKDHHNVKIRSLKNYTREQLLQHLNDTDWSKCLESTCVDAAWHEFKETFMNIVNTIAPVKEVRLKQRTEPWMTCEILSHIRNRDK